MIVIIDYGMGNIGSLQNMISRVGGEAIVSSDPEDIRKADKLVIPVVGAFDAGIERLKVSGLSEVLSDKVLVEKTPILCICLGMQLLAKSSEEGRSRGLGWLNARVERFKFAAGSDLKVPHMGWNSIEVLKPSKFLNGLAGETRYYFVHSYHVVCEDRDDVLATCYYGIDFVAAVQKNNIYGTQFHPEKSHKYGLDLMKKFVELG